MRTMWAAACCAVFAAGVTAIPVAAVAQERSAVAHERASVAKVKQRQARALVVASQRAMRRCTRPAVGGRACAPTTLARLAARTDMAARRLDRSARGLRLRASARAAARRLRQRASWLAAARLALQRSGSVASSADGARGSGGLAATVPLGGVTEAPSITTTVGTEAGTPTAATAASGVSVAIIDVVFAHDRRTATVVSSKGISHYETTLCDGTSSKVELPAGTDTRDLAVGPFAQAIVSIRVKSGSDLDGTTFVSGAECGPTDPAPEPETTGPVVSPTDPVNPTTTQTATVLPPPPPPSSPTCPAGASPSMVTAVGAFAIELRSCNGNVVRLYSDPYVSVSFPDLSLDFAVGYGQRSVEAGDSSVMWNTDAYHRIRTVEVTAGGSTSRVVPLAVVPGAGEAYAAATQLDDADLRDLALELAACEGSVFEPLECVDPAVLLETRPARMDRIEGVGQSFATARASVRIAGDTGDALRASSLIAFATSDSGACAATASEQALVPGTVRMGSGSWDWWSWWTPQVTVRGAFATTMSFTPRAGGPHLVCAYLSRLGATSVTAQGGIDVLVPRFEAATSVDVAPVERDTVWLTVGGTSDLPRSMTAFLGPGDVACSATASAHATRHGVTSLTPMQGNDLRPIRVVGDWSWSVEQRFQRAGAWRVCAYLDQAAMLAPDAIGDDVVEVAARSKGSGSRG